MKNFFAVIMIVFASIFFILSVIMLLRKGAPLKYKQGISEHEKSKIKKTTLTMFIYVFIESIAIYFIAFGLFLGLWYLYLIGLVLSIPTLIWAIKTLKNKT